MLLIHPSISLWTNTVKQEEILGTCKELFTASKSVLAPTQPFEDNLQAQRDESITIVVILLEHVRHPLQADTSLYEEIEAKTVFFAGIVGLEQHADVVITQLVAKGNEC